MFKSIGYRYKGINKATQKEGNESNSHTDWDSLKKPYLPYIKGVINKIAKLLNRQEIMTTLMLVETIKMKIKLVRDVANKRQLKGVYKIECSCGKFYVGETRCSFHTRFKEH